MVLDDTNGDEVDANLLRTVDDVIQVLDHVEASEVLALVHLLHVYGVCNHGVDQLAASSECE